MTGAINRTGAGLNFMPAPVRQLTNNKPVKVEIHTEHVRVLIDQRQCFNESGRMDIRTLAATIAQRSRQAFLEGISRRNSEGDLMAAPENRGKAIPMIAFNNSFEEKEFNMVTMPRSRPRIEFVGGHVDIRIE